MPRAKGFKHSPETIEKMRQAQRRRYERDGRVVESPWGEIGQKEYIRRWKLMKRYGVSLDEYEAMLEAQGGVCAICKKPPNGKNLSVDHCHRSEEVRGLLCQNCNLSLGHLEDHLENALKYLRGV